MVERRNFNWTRNYYIALLLDFFGYCTFGIWNRLRGFLRKRKTLEPHLIVVVALDHIGDVLLTTPAIRALRFLYPNAEISCLVGSWAKDVFQRNPHVSKTVVYDAPWYQRGSTYRFWSGISQFVKIMRTLRQEKVDLAIVFRPSVIDLAISYLMGADRRVGFAHKGGGFLLTDIVPWSKEQPTLDQNLEVVRFIGATYVPKQLEYFPLESENAYVDDVLQRHGVDPRHLIIGIAPTAGHNFWWSVENFAEVTRCLIQNFKAQVIFMGIQSHAPYIEDIRKVVLLPTISLAGETRSIGELAALIKRLDLLVTLDSAPRHLGVAMKIPVIFLRHGGDSMIQWGPYSEYESMVWHYVPCAPCGLRTCSQSEVYCMTLITPKQVLTIAEKILARSSKFSDADDARALK